MPKKALITGISGQDGSYLARFLLAKGYDVVGSSRGKGPASSFPNLERLGIANQVAVESVSLADRQSVVQAVKKHAPDEIYNLAGQSSVGLSFEQPFETIESITVATLNLLEAIRVLQMPIRLFNAGSGDCFGNTGGKPADENTPFRPQSPYGAARAAAFWEVSSYREAYNIFACSGILFNHESPLRPDRFVTRKIVRTACRIAKGSPEKLNLGNIDVQRDWGWAPEYVEAMWLMLQQQAPEDYIIATGETHPLEDFVQAVFASLNLDWQEHVNQNPDLLRPTDVLISRANPAKAANKLNWKAKYMMPDVADMLVQAELKLIS